MLSRVLLIAVLIILTGCGGSKKYSEIDSYLPYTIDSSNLVSINSYNNLDVARETLYNLFSNDDKFANRGLALNRLNRIASYQYNQYTTNYCVEGSFNKEQISNSRFRFYFNNCKKSGTDLYIDGQMDIVLDSNKLTLEFFNYKESSINKLHFIRYGKVIKDYDTNGDKLDIKVNNFSAYFRDYNKKMAYYNLNLTKYFYGDNREYSVDGYIYLDRFNGYVYLKTISNININSFDIKYATDINGYISILDKIFMQFNGNNLDYVYNGYYTNFTLNSFFEKF